MGVPTNGNRVHQRRICPRRLLPVVHRPKLESCRESGVHVHSAREVDAQKEDGQLGLNS
jgi:hypothetical protein